MTMTLPVIARLRPPVQPERWIQLLGPASGPSDVETHAMLEAEQAAGFAAWLEYRQQGRSARALLEISESVERQLLIAGLGRHRIRPMALFSRTYWRAP